MADYDDMKKRFNEEIHKLKQAKGKNTQLFTSDEYYSILAKVQAAKDKVRGKTPEEYQRLTRYDIVNIGTVKKLIVPVKNEGEPLVYYCDMEETFDIIHETHIYIGHGGRSKMMKELKQRYKNITKEFIALYLNLCETCKKRLIVPKKGPVAKSQVYSLKSSELNSLCQVDLIDMQTQPDGDFKFIMVYQDHFTKFVILKALKTKRAEEIASHLLDIFTTFGAPSILHTNNGDDFVYNVVVELCQMWEETIIVYGKHLHSQSQDLVERTSEVIENMVLTWLETNKTTKWSEGLKIIQFMRNKAYRCDIGRSPYEAMFGRKLRVGLKSVLLPFDGLQKTASEAMLVDGDSGESQMPIKKEPLT